MGVAGRTVAVVLLGLVPSTAGCSPGGVAAGPAGVADEHEVVVQTRLVGPRVHYFEGALVHLRLEPAASSADGATVPVVWGPEQVGGRARWPEVPEGEWQLVGSTRVCNGSCDELSGPVDVCAADLDVAADTSVVVTYRWGQPCQVTLS